MNQRDPEQQSVLVELLKTALEAGAERMEVEYEDRQDLVYAFKGNMGIGIASFDSDSPEADELRDDLWKRRRKKSKVEIAGIEYSLKVETYDSFGETCFRVSIHKP